MQETFQVAFGRRVQKIRKQRGWSQEKLAEKTGLTRETISRIETGKYGTHFYHVDIIRAAFNISFEEFFATFTKEEES